MPDAPDLLEQRTLRQRVGGRWAISWQAYLITAAIGLFALLTGEQHAFSSPSVLLSWLVLFTVAMGIVGGFVLAANFTGFRNRRLHPLPVWIVVVFNGICGALYSLLVSIGSQRLGLLTDISTLERTSINVVLAMWWGPTLSYFLDYRQQVSQERQQLLAEAVDVELARTQQDELTSRLREELLSEVNSELIPARAAIDEMLHSLDEDESTTGEAKNQDWQTAAELLRGTATNSVRPLSHRIWREDEEPTPRERWWNVPANIVQHQPFRPLAFAVVDVLGTLTQNARVFGFANALVLIATGLTITVSLMIAANFLMRRHARHHGVIFIGTLVALQLTVLIRTQLRESFIPGSAPLSWQLTQVFATVLVVFVTSGFGAWRDKRTETLVNLRNDIRQEQVVALARNKHVGEVAREMAQLLHGSVQSRLVACAMLLDSDGCRSDNATLNTALSQALEVLTEPIPERRRASSIVEEVERKVALWDGFCDVTVTISDTAAASTSGAIVGRVVEEGMTNALRHGRASRIEIKIDMNADGSITVVMIDDGIGPQHGAPGIGAAYLQQTTAGQWSLTALPDGSQLVATIV